VSTITSPNFHPGRLRPIRLVVIHTMESPETNNVAEAVARMFAVPGAMKSAHVCIDPDSEVRCVDDADTAWAAPGANADGLQQELAGRAGQTAGDWADAASQAILERSAQRTAIWCRTHGLPAVHLSDADLAAGRAGIIGHDAATRVYHQGTHWDPGPNFPWGHYMARVQQILTGTTPATEDDEMTPDQANKLDNLYAAMFNGGPSTPEGKSLLALVAETPAKVAGYPVSRVEGAPTPWVQDTADGTTAALALVAQMAALTAAVTALATAGGTDPGAVLAAARQGATEALSALTFTVAATPST